MVRYFFALDCDLNLRTKNCTDAYAICEKILLHLKTSTLEMMGKEKWISLQVLKWSETTFNHITGCSL